MAVTLYGMPWQAFMALSEAEKVNVRASGVPVVPRRARLADDAAPSRPASGSSVPPELMRRLRDLGLTPAQAEDLARLAPDELDQIMPTDEDLALMDRTGPGAPSAVDLIAQKARDAGVKLPPDWLSRR